MFHIGVWSLLEQAEVTSSVLISFQCYHHGDSLASTVMASELV